MHPTTVSLSRRDRCAPLRRTSGSGFKMRRTAILFIAAALLAQEPPTFRTNTNLVIVNVSVKDKSGTLIENLKKSDFTLLEDDKPQTISVFEVEHLANAALPTISVPEPQ